LPYKAKEVHSVKGQKTAEEITVEFYRTRFGEEITTEEARQINERVTVVFTLLAKWYREQRQEKHTSDDRTAG